MNLCDDGHDEVCYEGKHCPACNVRESKDYDIRELNDQIRELQSKVEELENAEE